MGFRADSTRNGVGFRASRVCAHRGVPYPYPLPKTTTAPNAVIRALAWAELYATSACGRARPMRQRSGTASGAMA